MVVFCQDLSSLFLKIYFTHKDDIPGNRQVGIKWYVIHDTALADDWTDMKIQDISRLTVIIIMWWNDAKDKKVEFFNVDLGVSQLL